MCEVVDDCVKVVMSNLSVYGVKLVFFFLLVVLEEELWWIKVGLVEFFGVMVYCVFK